MIDHIPLVLRTPYTGCNKSAPSANLYNCHIKLNKSSPSLATDLLIQIIVPTFQIPNAGARSVPGINGTPAQSVHPTPKCIQVSGP